MASRFWHLIVYVDSDATPKHMTFDRPLSVAELTRMLEESTGHSIVNVTYWDPQVHTYLPLESLEPVERSFGRAQLWLQSDNLRLEEVPKDDAEFLDLKPYANAVSNDYVAYTLSEAHRVVFPRLERQFAARMADLLEPNAQTLLLFYTGNANPSSDAVQGGFTLPKGGSGITFSTSLSDPSQTQVPGQVQKVLLCEVAVGRIATPSVVYSPETGQPSRVFDPTQGDSMVAFKSNTRTYTVFHPRQAIPRYILALKGATASSRPRGATPTSQAAGRSSSGERGGARTSTGPSPTMPVPSLQPPPATTAQSVINPKSETPQEKVDKSSVCSAHKGEQTTLWCATCGHLVCPYCLSVGQHRGHDGRELDDIIVKYRAQLSEVVSALGERSDAANKTLDMIHSTKRELEERKKQGEEAVRSAFEELSTLLQNRQKQLIDELSAKSTQADAHVETLKTYVSDCVTKKKEFDASLIASQDGSRSGKMSFLQLAPKLLSGWSANPMSKPPLPNIPSASALVHTYFDARPAQVAIRSLSLQKNPTRHTASPADQDSHDASSPNTQSAVVVQQLQQQTLVQKMQLDDLCGGHIWIIPNAEKIFHVDQRKDIFSDVFYLGGAAWELRIASEALPGLHSDSMMTLNHTSQSVATTSAGEVQDHLSVYLHCVNHSHRLNYRVIMFAAGVWHVREAKGWSSEFTGKGWGVRPFCTRKALLSDFVRDGAVKICVAPMGGLY